MIISNIFNIYLFNINENYNSRLMFIHCWISEFIEQCKYKKKYVLIPPFSNLPFRLSCLFLKTFMYIVHSMYFQNNLIFRFRSESNFIIYSFLTGKLDFTFFQHQIYLRQISVNEYGNSKMSRTSRQLSFTQDRTRAKLAVKNRSGIRS